MLVVAVPVYQMWRSRHRRAHVGVETIQRSVPVLVATIRNYGEPDLMIDGPAYFAVDTSSRADWKPARVVPENPKLHRHGVKENGRRFGSSSSPFPMRLRSRDELATEIIRTHLADIVWMYDCIGHCLVRATYAPTTGRPFEPRLFEIPFDEWLPVDASARKAMPQA